MLLLAGAGDAPILQVRAKSGHFTGGCPLDLKQIQDLIERISSSDFTCFELEHEGFRLKLERNTNGTMQSEVRAAPAPVAQMPVAAPTAQQAPPPLQAAPAPAEDLYEIKSPIVGTFFRSPSPETEAFVESGSQVKSGQVLCIVEAMKLMNEIECDLDGEVVDVLVANGQPVEYGEVLFRLRPSAA
jgi:acetyl-CoA carboxylase biotin carboxyl carrier protein